MPHPPTRYLHMISSDRDNWAEEWFRQLGFVGYYFGQLEWAPCWLADQVGSQTQQRKLPKMSFAERCNFAKTALVPKLNDLALKEEWSTILDEVGACGKMRNTSAIHKRRGSAAQMKTRMAS